jgi:hypothetical protein
MTYRYYDPSGSIRSRSKHISLQNMSNQEDIHAPICLENSDRIIQNNGVDLANPPRLFTTETEAFATLSLLYQSAIIDTADQVDSPFLWFCLANINEALMFDNCSAIELVNVTERCQYSQGIPQGSVIKASIVSENLFGDNYHRTYDFDETTNTVIGSPYVSTSSPYLASTRPWYGIQDGWTEEYQFWDIELMGRTYVRSSGDITLAFDYSDFEGVCDDYYINTNFGSIIGITLAGFCFVTFFSLTCGCCDDFINDKKKEKVEAITKAKENEGIEMPTISSA